MTRLPTPSRRSVLAALGTVPLVTGTATTAAAVHSGRIPTELKPGGEYDRFVAELAARDEFSGTVLLTHGGKPVLRRSHGMANRDLSTPNGPDTIFSVGSITKMFTGIAIAQLAQESKIAYNEKLGTYLDGFPTEIAETVTIHQLLTHTSGVGRPPTGAKPIPGSENWDTLEEIFEGNMAHIRGLPLNFTPGSSYAYSNDAYFVLGAIIAELSAEKSYYDYVRNHIFIPAGMTNSLFPTKTEWRESRRIAQPYIKDDTGEWTNPLDTGTGGTASIVGLPAGGAFTTAADLVRFATALRNNDLLEPAHTYLATSPKQPIQTTRSLWYTSYAPANTLVNNQWVLGHNGGTAGVAANLDWFRHTDWQTVVLCNHGNIAPNYTDLIDKPRTYITA